jgi:membrane-associated phospholipid phosphatase
MLRFVFLGAALNAWFLLVYGGADWVTGRHSYRVPIAMDWESRIPYLPASVVAYMSIYGLFLLAPFALRETRQLNQLAAAIFVMIAIAGVFFLAVPGELTFPPQEPKSWKTWIWVADTLNLHYNCVPSLHVGLSVACVAAFTRYTGGMFSFFLWLWAAAVAASTMLLHQHHLIDVLTGWWLGLFCVRRFFPSAK